MFSPKEQTARNVNWNSVWWISCNYSSNLCEERACEYYVCSLIFIKYTLGTKLQMLLSSFHLYHLLLFIINYYYETARNLKIAVNVAIWHKMIKLKFLKFCKIYSISEDIYMIKSIWITPIRIDNCDLKWLDILLYIVNRDKSNIANLNSNYWNNI